MSMMISFVCTLHWTSTGLWVQLRSAFLHLQHFMQPFCICMKAVHGRCGLLLAGFVQYGLYTPSPLLSTPFTLPSSYIHSVLDKTRMTNLSIVCKTCPSINSENDSSSRDSVSSGRRFHTAQVVHSSSMLCSWVSQQDNGSDSSFVDMLGMNIPYAYSLKFLQAVCFSIWTIADASRITVVVTGAFGLALRSLLNIWDSFCWRCCALSKSLSLALQWIYSLEKSSVLFLRLSSCCSCLLILHVV